MSERTAVHSILSAVLICCAGAGTLMAQENSTKSATAEAEKPKVQAPAAAAYRLDFLISEMEDGRRINSRRYTMSLKTNDGEELKIGTRVPVQSKGDEFQYLDVGTNLYARLFERDGQLQLDERMENSSLALPAEGGGSMTPPVVRQLKIDGSTVVVSDKPMVMGVAEDPNSRRQFELEVTVTKLR